MKNQMQKERGVTVFNELICAEMAAVEVYGLAAQLLGDSYDSPDYEAFYEAHQIRVDLLSKHVCDRGGEPRSTQLSWDRPHSALLSAATIYGSESPIPSLLAQEKEILALYKTTLSDDGLAASLRAWIAETLWSDAVALVRRLELLQQKTRVVETNLEVTASDGRMKDQLARGAVA